MKNKILLSMLLLATASITVTAQEMGTFTDARDGKIYQTVVVGTQTWMAQNLAYKTYSDCWPPNGSEANVTIHGYLYSWLAARMAAPPGWHVPSDSEWTILDNYLGKNLTAGEKLKATTGWQFNNNGNNQSGFTALPSGCYVYEFKIYTSFQGIGAWWSSTIDITPLSKKEKKAGKHFPAFNRYLMFQGLEKKHDDVNDGLSVRCIKD